MGLFRLDEVLQMAMQAEESGRLLYQAAAAGASDAGVAHVCKELAAQEAKHFQTFKAMLDAQRDQTNTRRLALEEMEFVQSLVQGRVIPDEAEAKRVVRENSLSQLLDMAIQAEAGSVAFYEQILPEVDAADAGAIREIVAEEKSHEQRLREVKQSLKA